MIPGPLFLNLQKSKILVGFEDLITINAKNVLVLSTNGTRGVFGSGTGVHGPFVKLVDLGFRISGPGIFQVH